MGPESTDEAIDAEAQPPKTITERFNDLEAGDTVMVNNHERTYEVVDTDTYSIVAEDGAGHGVTFSQNLQTGGWTVSEDVFRVETE